VAAIRVKSTSVAGTQKELRFFKPSHRATQMGAVGGDYLELITLNPSNLAGQSRGFSVGLTTVRIFVHSQPHLSFGEF